MQNKYIRLFLGKDDKKIGGLFIETGKLLKRLYDEDDPVYDDINYHLSQLENEMDVPDLDYKSANYGFAFKSEFIDRESIDDIIDNLDYYLRLVDYEIISEVININSDDIVYQDDVQIAYTIKESTDLIMKPRLIVEKLETHDTLNPKIWNSDMTLRSDVEQKLYNIIDEFVENSHFLTTDDIITANIVGSNASYNYTEFSDLDLHIVVNLSDLSEDEKFAGYTGDCERIMFNRRYEIEMNGVDVELYVEDIRTAPVSNGIYDLFKGEWIRKPIKLVFPEVNNNLYKSVYNAHKDNAVKLLSSAKSAKEINNFVNDLYLTRRNSLAEDGEVGIGNQVFKDLRNEGLLDQLKDKYYELRSAELSLTDVDSDTKLESILRYMTGS